MRKGEKIIKTRKISGLLIAAVIASLLAGCGDKDAVSGKTSQKADSAETAAGENGLAGEGLNEAAVIRIGYNPTFGTQLTALEEKFHYIEEEFAKDDIKVEFYSFEKGPALMEALAAGGIDISDAVGDGPFITAAAAGNGITGIAVGKDDKTSNGTYIVVDEGSGIESVADLKGKNVATAIGTAGHLFLTCALNDAGLSIDDVNIINLIDTEYLAALEGNSIDACVTPEAMALTIINTGAAYQLDVPKIELAPLIYVARSEFAEENPKLVARFLKVLLQYNDYAVENREETQKLIAESFDISPDSLSGYLKYTYDMDLDDSFYTRLQKSIDFYAGQEIIEGLDADAVTDSRYLEEAQRLYEEDKQN